MRKEVYEFIPRLEAAGLTVRRRAGIVEQPKQASTWRNTITKIHRDEEVGHRNPDDAGRRDAGVRQPSQEVLQCARSSPTSSSPTMGSSSRPTKSHFAYLDEEMGPRSALASPPLTPC
jgi:hypothetical protein